MFLTTGRRGQARHGCHSPRQSRQLENPAGTVCQGTRYMYLLHWSCLRFVCVKLRKINHKHAECWGRRVDRIECGDPCISHRRSVRDCTIHVVRVVHEVWKHFPTIRNSAQVHNRTDISVLWIQSITWHTCSARLAFALCK